MKKCILLIFIVLLIIGCNSPTNTIVVRNLSNFKRINEIVEVNIPVLVSDEFKEGYVLLDENNNEIIYQLQTDSAERVKSILFHANVEANSTSTYYLKRGLPTQIYPKTFADYIVEFQDFIWENDFAGYRMFGSGKSNTNGVDLWFKKTDSLIMQKLFDNEINKGLSFYVDRGEGFNAYTVGNSLGAGGIAPVTDKLWINGYFNNYEIIEQGPLRSVFRLVYDSVAVDSIYLKQTLTITVDAGSILNKAVVHYEGVDIPMNIAAGIFLHNNKGTKLIDAENNIIAYAADAFTRWGRNLGRYYVGIYMPGLNMETLEIDNHLVIVNSYRSGYDFTYFFGGVWSENGFPQEKDFFSALVEYSKAYREPLKLNFR